MKTKFADGVEEISTKVDQKLGWKNKISLPELVRRDLCTGSEVTKDK